MCDFHAAPASGEDEWVLDTPRIRDFIADVRSRITGDARASAEAIRPLFSELIEDRTWLPEEYARDAPDSGMGGVIGLYRGNQDEEFYRPGGGRLELLRRRPLDAGDFYQLLPPEDDIHRVRTTSDVTSVSIHLLANDTGCVWRHTYDEQTGEAKPFRSGYVNAQCDS